MHNFQQQLTFLNMQATDVYLKQKEASLHWIHSVTHCKPTVNITAHAYQCCQKRLPSESVPLYSTKIALQGQQASVVDIHAMYVRFLM